MNRRNFLQKTGLAGLLSFFGLGRESKAKEAPRHLNIPNAISYRTFAPVRYSNAGGAWRPIGFEHTLNIIVPGRDIQRVTRISTEIDPDFSKLFPEFYA